MSILVVDDYPSVRRIVKNCLRQLGFENVTEAESGNAALEQAQTTRFDFIISDWSMPDADPVEFLRAIREHGANKDVPVLVVAAEQERSKVSNLDIKSHLAVIVKPFTRDILQKKMEAAINAEEAQQGK